jgi:DNA repair exonuclease SbcCD nuclease subunit
MNNITIVGDIHLGKPFPFTSTKTAARWAQYKKDLLIWFTEEYKGSIIQAGDLFDSFSCNSETFVEGYMFAASCEVVLSGNHDVSNNTEKESAVNLLRKTGCTIAWEQPYFFETESTKYTLLPHQLTQEKFDTMLASAKNFPNTEKYNILVLHCNFGDQPGTETENYLRPNVAAHLMSDEHGGHAMKHFDAIISGHEHNYREPMIGVTMLGSVLPMSFGEMTDKFISVDGTKECVWPVDGRFRSLDYKDFLAYPLDAPLQFIEITGTVDIGETIAINSRIAEWYKTSETLIAIKPNTRSLKAETDVIMDEDGPKLHWVEKIADSLSADAQEVFKQLLEESNEA